jgi:hypothetical protein
MINLSLRSKHPNTQRDLQVKGRSGAAEENSFEGIYSLINGDCGSGSRHICRFWPDSDQDFLWKGDLIF